MILRNGQPYAIDTPFTLDDGTQFPSNWYRFASEEDRANLGFKEVPDPEPVDERFHYINTNGSVSEKPIELVRTTFKNQLANIRWNNENAGIVFSNSVFATDTQSRVNYLAVNIQAQANSKFSVSWKAKDPETNESKFVTLKSSDILSVTGNVMDYVSKCFQKEESLVQEINTAEDIEGLSAIDMNVDWPTREY